MIFLQGLYEWLAASLESSVNHFPLIQLVFNSVDKTILYYLIFLVLRAAYLLRRHRKTGKKIPLYKEGLLHALFIYIVLLLQLTVFRNEVTFWTVEYHKIDWSAIHWLPLVNAEHQLWCPIKTLVSLDRSSSDTLPFCHNIFLTLQRLGLPGYSVVCHESFFESQNMTLCRWSPKYQ